MIKQDCEQPKKYLVQANIATSLDICFVIDKSVDALPAQYTASKQKKIVGLFEKIVFKVVTINSIRSNVQIFNFRFIDKIKNLDIDKVYKKSQLIIQAYKNKEKDLILTQSPTI